jgi:hypothetical protein
MSYRVSFRAASMAALVFATSVAIRGASPTFWHVATQAEFLKGDAVENIAVDGDGRLLLAPANDVVYEATTPFLWSAVADAEGGVWIGTGNPGRVLRIDPSRAATTVLDAGEMQVQALTFGPGGTVYAATSPDGKVYRIGTDRQVTPVFDPEDKYIWALAAGPDGVLYVGTGEKGLVYRVGPDGKGAPWLKTAATNVTALAFDGQGRLLVGTESPGRVLRVTPDGRAFVVVEVPNQEIRRIRVDERGRAFVATIAGGKTAEAAPQERQVTPEPAPTTLTPSVSTEITVTAIGDLQVPVAAAPQAAPVTRKDVKGAVYRIDPTGLWQVIWESREDSPYDVAVEGDALLVATGAKGKVLRIAGDPARASLVVRAAAQQVTGFVRTARNELLYITSNPGKLYRTSTTPASKGVYESDVRDAGTVATWGTIRWHAAAPAGCAVEISTRAGNTSRPDDTWSEWSPAYGRAEGTPIASPPARYLQWRAVLSGTQGATPSLMSVTAAYLPRNARPTLETITVHPPGVVFQRPFSTGEMELAGFGGGSSDGRPLSPVPPTGASSTPTLGRRTFQKGLQTFVWKAEDADQDRLQFDVWYRREGDATWQALERGLWDSVLTWDTTSVPDGTYTIRVVASDAPVNAPDTALTVDLESDSFEVDNTPPTIEFVVAGGPGTAPRLAFTVRDTGSTVQRAEYSLDAGRWRVIYPTDGMADSRLEQYEIALDRNADIKTLVVRASDALNNVATGMPARRP